MCLRLAVRVTAMAMALGSGAIANAFTITPTSIIHDGMDSSPVRIAIDAAPLRPLALEFRIVERMASGNTERLVVPEDGALEVHPPQVFIPLGGRAEVAVRWVGAPREGSPRSFYLIADELPVEFSVDEVQQGLRFLTRVHLPVHVGRGGQPDLVVQIIKADGAQKMAIVNRGTGYVRFAELDLRISLGESQRVISGPDLARVARVDAILPGRTVELAADQLGLGQGDEMLELIARTGDPDGR